MQRAGEPETTVDTDEGYRGVEWRGSSHDGVGLLLYADSTKLRVSVTEDLLLSSPQLCPPVSWASDTRTLISPHKQALPVCHSLTGPRSHLDSSLPLTVSARAKQPPDPADSTSQGSLKYTHFPHGHRPVHTTMVSLHPLMTAQPDVVFLEYLSHTLPWFPVHLRK